MTLNSNPTARRSGFGGAQARGVGGPGRTATPADSGSGGGGRGGYGDKPKPSWTTAVALYDEYHSSMEVQIVAETFRTAVAIKLAPVFAEAKGPSEAAKGQRKYNHDESAMVVLDLNEVIVLREQLNAFINGDLSEVMLARLETKRLLLLRAEAYYDNTHPEYQIHANGLALSIEEDPSDKSTGKVVVFISRQSAVVLADGAEPVAFYPEMQALLAVLDSYLANCARVDYASVRLLNNAAKEAAPVGPTASMPMRRGGIGAPVARGAASAAPAGSGGDAEQNDVSAPAGQVQQQAGAVADVDLDAALGGEVPKF
jgi:hypothetical protein